MSTTAVQAFTSKPLPKFANGAQIQGKFTKKVVTIVAPKRYMPSVGWRYTTRAFSDLALEDINFWQPYVPKENDGAVFENPPTNNSAKGDSKRREKGIARIKGMFAQPCTDLLLTYLVSVREHTRLRFSWTASLHEDVGDLFNRLGIVMPEDARGIDSGKFGGRAMYSLSSELHFPVPTNLRILPENAKIQDGIVYISDVGLGLYLAQQGFVINAYAKV